MYVDYLMDIFKYPGLKNFLGRKREVLLKARILCIIENADYYTENFLRKITDATCYILSCMTFNDEAEEKGYYVGNPTKSLLELEELSKVALAILPSAIRNEMPNAEQEKSYQYIYNLGDITKIITKSMSSPNMAKRDWNSFTPYRVKLSESISRTRRKVYELAMCNEWQYYVTFTINKEKFDRCDIDGFMEKFSKWLNNYKRKLNGKPIQYLFVVEQGRKGSHHLHGLMNGIPSSHLSPFVRGKHPRELVDKGYLNWQAYEDKFGYCSFGEIRNKKAVAKYLMKKICTTSKVIERGRHKRLYYCSNGLDRAKEIARGYDLFPPNDFDYQNKHTRVKWLKSA